MTPPGRGGPHEPPGARLERLRAVLTQVDDEASSGKVPALIAGLIIGGVSIPTGVVMMDRSDDAQEIGGAIVLGTGIGAVLGGVIQLFVPVGATMDMGDELERAMASGAPADVVVRSVEQQWAQAAADLRTSRKISGGISIGVGALALAGGTALALVDTGADLSSTEQAVFASALIAGGGIMAVGGIQIFFMETPQEVAWSTYAAATGIEEEPLLVAPRLELGALPGGAGVAFGAQF